MRKGKPLAQELAHINSHSVKWWQAMVVAVRQMESRVTPKFVVCYLAARERGESAGDGFGVRCGMCDVLMRP